MLIGIPVKYSVSETVEYLKGKSCFIIFDSDAKINIDMEIKGFGIALIQLGKIQKNVSNRSK